MEWLTHMPCATFVTDTMGFIRLYNEAAVTLWGRRPEIGETRWTATSREVTIERPDRTKCLVLVQSKPILDGAGETEGMVNVMIDVTDKSGALKASEERYHKMIAEVEDYAILLLDRDGVIQNWNVGAEKIKGYKESEIVGRHFRVFYTPEDRVAALPERLIDEASKMGKAIHEGWRQRKDGTLFWGSVVITALHDADGVVIGFSKVTRDLTARRMAEQSLKRYSQELEFQNRELQQFAYAAAHDMKEPLRKLRFYNTALTESMEGRLSEKEDIYLHRSTDAAARMQRLIDDLLAYSKASTAGDAFTMVDLEMVLSEALSTYQDLIEETGAAIQVGGLTDVWGITFQLRQLFENLLGNALKYQDPSRKAVIRIRGENVVYAPEGSEVNHAEEYLKITVTDNGIGFEGGKAVRIFDIFQRLNNGGELPGTGIGLAICKRVVQNHRGFIFANGKPGVGAEFTIYLPAKRSGVGISEGE
jgi:PAS domain S-box-containing protein